MEQEIHARFNDEILDEARTRYGIPAAGLTNLGGYESFIYAFEQDGKPYILRLGHSRRRSEALIRGEVDWINYLAEHGTSVAKAVVSKQDRLVEPIADGQGGQFLATAFVRAPGGPAPWNLWEDDAGFCRRYGRLLGKMHRLASTYEPRDAGAKRPLWNEPDNNVQLAKVLPPSDAHILARSDALIDHFATLPTDAAHFGMIHQDAHGGNFFMDEHGTLTLFDFDDCTYMWYANDVAMVVFYATMLGREEAFAQKFLADFLVGYREEWEINGRWLAEMPHFMKLREIDLYAIITRDFTPEQIAGDNWLRSFMTGRRERIEQDVPYLDVDFTRFC